MHINYATIQDHFFLLHYTNCIQLRYTTLITQQQQQQQQQQQGNTALRRVWVFYNCVIESKITFFTVIYSILWLWSMMFCRLLQEVKMPKKTFAIPQHLLEVQCILFFLSALSVGILRFEELAQSLDVLMLVCKSKMPWSHIDSKVGQRVFGRVILQSKGTLSSPPPTPPPPLQVKVARRQQQSWATCLR